MFDSPAQSLRTMEKWKLWFRIDQISLSDWDDWVIERLRCLYRDSQSDHYQPDHVSSSLSTELKIKTEFKSKVRFKIMLLISPVNVTNVECLNVKHTHYTLLYQQQCQSLKPCISPPKKTELLQHEFCNIYLCELWHCMLGGNLCFESAAWLVLLLQQM